MSKKNWPKKVKEVMDALFENAAEAECDNSMYVEKDGENVWRILCNYERSNSILVYVNLSVENIVGDKEVREDQWYYQVMYGDFGSMYGIEDNLIRINGRLSKPMKNNHNEALANAEIWYTG